MAKNNFGQNWQIYPDPRAGSPLNYIYLSGIVWHFFVTENVINIEINIAHLQPTNPARKMYLQKKLS